MKISIYTPGTSVNVHIGGKQVTKQVVSSTPTFIAEIDEDVVSDEVVRYFQTIKGLGVTTPSDNGWFRINLIDSIGMQTAFATSMPSSYGNGERLTNLATTNQTYRNEDGTHSVRRSPNREANETMDTPDAQRTGTTMTSAVHSAAFAKSINVVDNVLSVVAEAVGQYLASLPPAEVQQDEAVVDEVVVNPATEAIVNPFTN